MGMQKVWGLAIGMILFTSSLCLAKSDTPGCKDHPLLTRMKDFYIYQCEEIEFDQMEFKVSAEESKTVEGRKHTIEYWINDGAGVPSPHQIFKNIENAVTAIGGKLFYKTNSIEGYLNVQKGSRTYWIYLYPDNGEFYKLKIIEEEKMEQEVVADAESLERDISMTGHAAVYGIYFDFDKTDIKPESDKALKEVTKLLQKNPDLKLHVVGHTDNKGDFGYNLDLSQRRAKAVVKTLVSKYGVNPDRLKAHGIGPLSPVNSNRSDAGRAKNRRVELVEQ